MLAALAEIVLYPHEGVKKYCSPVYVLTSLIYSFLYIWLLSRLLVKFVVISHQEVVDRQKDILYLSMMELHDRFSLLPQKPGIEFNSNGVKLVFNFYLMFLSCLWQQRSSVI